MLHLIIVDGMTNLTALTNSQQFKPIQGTFFCGVSAAAWERKPTVAELLTGWEDSVLPYAMEGVLASRWEFFVWGGPWHVEMA